MDDKEIIKKHKIDPYINLMGMGKVSISGRHTRVLIPKNIVKVLDLVKHKEEGEDIYLTFRIKEGKINMYFTDYYAREIYEIDEKLMEKKKEEENKWKI